MRAPREQDRSLRVFFAAPVPDSARREIAAQVEGVRSEARDRIGSGAHGWVPAANYHVTLRFLGSVAREDLAALNDAAERALAERSAFVVETGAPLWLRAHRGRQVLALSVHPEGPLQQLARALAEGSAEQSAGTPAPDSLRQSAGTPAPDSLRQSAGAPPRGLQLPHLTLARLHRDTRRALELSDRDFSPVSWEVREVGLFESRSTANGVRYETVASIPLERSTLAPRIVHQGEEHGSQRFH